MDKQQTKNTDVVVAQETDLIPAIRTSELALAYWLAGLTLSCTNSGSASIRKCWFWEVKR